MLVTTIQLKISNRLTTQVTTIICHHMKKLLLKKERKYKNTGGLDQNPYINKKRYIGRLYIFIQNSKNIQDENLLYQ